MRSYYSIPADVKIVVSAPKPSEFPNFDALTITFDRGEKKQDFEFLLSKDGKTLIRLTRLRSQPGSVRRADEEDQCQRAADAGQQERQSRGRQLR